MTLDWSYLAGWFDNSGSVYEKRTSTGLEARLRFSSYDRGFLEKVRLLVGGGGITREPRAKGSYFRLTLTGYHRVEETLSRMLPHLVRKRQRVKEWLALHRAETEVRRLQRRLHLKPGEYLRSEFRQAQRAIHQLPPPLGDTD